MEFLVRSQKPPGHFRANLLTALITFCARHEGKMFEIFLSFDCSQSTITIRIDVMRVFQEENHQQLIIGFWSMDEFCISLISTSEKQDDNINGRLPPHD
jgi:hypothetical protein